MHKRARLLIGSVIAVMLLIVVLKHSAGRLLRGSVITDPVITTMLSERADLDGDAVLSPREMRVALTAIIRGVISGNAEQDINGDGTVNGADIADSVRTFKTFLTAVCGNGILEGDEECDVGEQQGDMCVGRGADCMYCSNCTYVTADRPFFICGNGVKEGSEQCDDGNAIDNDGCSANCSTESSVSNCGLGTGCSTE